MRIPVMKSVAVAVVVAGLTLVFAPGAQAAGKNHASSSAPWLIGLAVVVVLLLGGLLFKLRRGAAKRNEPGDFRR